MYEKILLNILVEEGKKVDLNKVLKLLEFGIIHHDKIDQKILYNGLYNIIKDKEEKKIKKLKKEILQKSLF